MFQLLLLLIWGTATAGHGDLERLRVDHSAELVQSVRANNLLLLEPLKHANLLLNCLLLLLLRHAAE